SGPHREGHPHTAAGCVDGGCHARTAPGPGVRAAARDGPRRRGARSAHRVVAAYVGKREPADRDCLEPGAWDPGTGSGDLGGNRRSGAVWGGRRGPSLGRHTAPYRLLPSLAARPIRDLLLLAPPHARDATGPAIPAARRLDGGSAVALGGTSPGALVGELRGRSPHRPHRPESHHVAGVGRLCGDRGRLRGGARRRRGVDAVPGVRDRGRPHRKLRAGARRAIRRDPPGERIRDVPRRDRPGGARRRHRAGRGVSSVRRRHGLLRERGGAPVAVSEMSSSALGKPIYFVIASDPTVTSPGAAAESGKLVVYLQANIHGGEVEGKEAVLALLRELAGPRRDLLQRLVVLVAPDYNPDGNDAFGPQAVNRSEQNGPAVVGQRPDGKNLDLNRDYFKAEAPETRASLARVYTTWDPALMVDLHTTDGTLHGYQLTYAPPLDPNGPAGPSTFVRDRMLPALRKTLQDKYHE